MGITSRILQRFSTRDLVLIAILAALGIAIKPVVVPLAHVVTAPLFIPGGALAGGLYMMWLVVGMGIVGKRGTATLIALVQALLVMFTGVVGSHGAMSLVSYTAPGVVMDLGLLVIGHSACCLACCTIAGVLANVTGTLTVSVIFFRLPPIPLALAVATAALSGAIGGVLAAQVAGRLRRYRIGVRSERSSAVAVPTAGRGRHVLGRGTLILSITAVVLAAALVARAATGCSGASSAPPDGGARSGGTPDGAAEIALVDAASGENGSLDLTATAVPGNGEGEKSLGDVLRADGRDTTGRITVYGADGSITSASADECTLTRHGTLLIDGDDAGAIVGIVLNPPRASVRDVRALAQNSLAAGGRALILYLDGFGWDMYVAARERGDLRHLARLSPSKALSVYPTITPVAFAAMVSGGDPATTGVRDRSSHRLSCDSVFGWAEARGLSTSLIEGDRQILELTSATSLNPDADADGTTDDEVFSAAEQRIARGQPDLMLVHVHGIDDVAASHGPSSAETGARIRDVDAAAGALMRRWRGLVIVTADHGLHTVESGAGGRAGEHGDFCAEDLLVPLLVRDL